MGFANEVAASKPGATTQLPTQSAEPAAPVEQQQEFQPMPAHGDVHPDQAGQQQVETPEAAPAKSSKIRIGTQMFDSADDAYAYAQQLEITLAQKDAIDQYKADQNKPEPEPEVDEYAELEASLFEDPKGTLKKLTEKARKEALAEIKKQQDEQLAQAQAQQAEETAWAEFSSANADLAPNRDLVNYVMEKNWQEISKAPVEARAELLAEKTRSLLGIRRQASLPSKELQSRAVAGPSSSSVANMSQEKKADAPVDFISQVNKLRKRT